MELSTSTLNLGELPSAAFQSVKERLALCQQINAAPKKLQACEELASQVGITPNSLYRLFRKWVASGKDWHAILDRRLVPKTWKRTQSKDLPHAFINHFKALCESNQRGSKAAHRLILRQLHEWRCGTGEAVPGYEYPPGNQRGKEFPRGWSYENLMNYLPTDIELTAARQGRSKAKELLPSVLTTRVNLYPFAEYQFDDMWHDLLINVLGQTSARRLLEFCAVDTFSGYIFKPGLKARVTDEVTKKNRILNSQDFLHYVTYILTVVGYHPQGTVLNMENATASIPTSTIETIGLLTNGLVKVIKSGMDGRGAFPTQYEAQAKGNYRLKALKECLGNLIHNETAFLPGNTGLDRNHSPAELHGLNKENDLLLAIAALKPHLADQLQYGFLGFQDAHITILEIYDRINRRIDHRMEGFEEAGLVVNEIRLDPAHPWMPLEGVQKLDEEKRRAIATLVRFDEQLRRRRLMSPLEVVQREEQKLIRLPFSSLPNLLGPDAGTVKEVRQCLFHFENQEIGERKFLAKIQDEAGTPRLIPNGTRCRVFLNPYVPDRLIVADAESNEFLGECEPWNRVDRSDLDAIHKQAGRAERLFKAATMEAGLRSSRSKIERQRHNANVIRKSRNGLDAKLEGVDATDLLAEDRLNEPELTETETLLGHELLND